MYQLDGIRTAVAQLCTPGQLVLGLEKFTLLNRSTRGERERERERGYAKFSQFIAKAARWALGAAESLTGSWGRRWW